MENTKVKVIVLSATTSELLQEKIDAEIKKFNPQFKVTGISVSCSNSSHRNDIYLIAMNLQEITDQS